MHRYRHIPLHPMSPQDAAVALADDAPHSPTRRRALRLMAASAALAGAGCSGPPQETIVPYVRAPEQLVPGQPVFYATALTRRGYAHGVLVRNDMGRPTKVEGNPHHPASGGATDAHSQAAILQLWDPERSQFVMNGAAIATWQALAGALTARRGLWQRNGGAGLRILTGTVTSPTLTAQLSRLLARYPAARWHQYDPLHDDHGYDGARLAYGRPVDFVARPDQAQVVLCLDADPLGTGPGSVAFSGQFVQDRNSRATAFSRRLYVAESCPSLTGAAAEHRLALPPWQIEQLLGRLGARFGVCAAPPSMADPWARRWEGALGAALAQHRGASLVMAGGGVGPLGRAIAIALNSRLGNLGRTVLPIAPVEAQPEHHRRSLAALADDLHAGAVDTICMLGVNPVYDAPGALDFAAALRRAASSVHLGLYRDETALASTWHVPATHCFEHWSDARAYDGSASIVQPMIMPLYDGHAPHALLALLGDDADEAGLALVQRTWRDRQRAADFDAWWADTLQRGVIDGSAAPAMALPPLRPLPAPVVSTQSPPAGAVSLPVLLRADPSVGAGEYANSGWLQELPDPLTGLTWDNAAMLGVRTAARLGLGSGDIVGLIADHGGHAPARTVDAPVWVMPGHAEDCLTLPLGYGRSAAGSVGNGVGFNAYPLMPLAGVALASVTPRGRRHAFARPQQHTRMEGRALARSGTLAAFRLDPQFASAEERARPPAGSLYPPVPYPGYKWGMAIDLNACIGCGACTVACQAENNIPVVGKEQVQRGRIMHWIRVDRYERGGDAVAARAAAHAGNGPDSADMASSVGMAGGAAIGDGADGAAAAVRANDARSPWRSIFQPVPCMHCEDAPCEEVCPVGATVHDSEGINVQVYNRCVGTRFCSNNCPYKVRRFNFLQFEREDVAADAARRNPDVTVRRRGVMEKCNYCLQRITRARLAAEQLGRPLRDGEVVTACQAVCPTQAIVFGDLNDPASQVRLAKASPLDYVLLSELNTRPRTSYAARVRNADAALE